MSSLRSTTSSRLTFCPRVGPVQLCLPTMPTQDPILQSQPMKSLEPVAAGPHNIPHATLSDSAPVPVHPDTITPQDPGSHAIVNIVHIHKTLWTWIIWPYGRFKMDAVVQAHFCSPSLLLHTISTSHQCKSHLPGGLKQLNKPQPRFKVCHWVIELLMSNGLLISSGVSVKQPCKIVLRSERI